MPPTAAYGITATAYGNGSTTYRARCHECTWTGPERPRRNAAEADHRAHHRKAHA